MKLLDVPYISQININACRAAVLEMIYKYYDSKNISQQEIMDKYQELEPHGSGNFRLTTDSLVIDARENGYKAGWGRANWQNSLDAIDLVKTLISAGIPVIVCQKFTDELCLIGHFRIVLGIDEEYVYLHDPSSEIGGANLKWPINRFINFWEATGQNVTGGIFIFISK